MIDVTLPYECFECVAKKICARDRIPIRVAYGDRDCIDLHQRIKYGAKDKCGAAVYEQQVEETGPVNLSPNII